MIVVELKELFLRAKKGDQEAFVDLLTHYKSKIYRTAFIYLKNKADALDVVQEVTIKAYKSLKKMLQLSF